ncbi:MFS transporter [Chloroflexota bacterium]
MIKKVFPVLALAMFSSILGNGIITPILPLYVQSMGATGFWLGVIMASFGATSIASTPIFGRLSDRKGRKLFLCAGLLSYAIISLGYIGASDVLTLTLVRALQGAASGMIIPIALAYIGDISPKREEGKWMGYANAAFFSGFGFGPLMGGILTEHFGMTVTFSLMAVLNLFAFLVALIFLPDVKSRQLRKETYNLSFREMNKSKMVQGIFTFRLTQSVGRAASMTFLPIFAATYIGLSLTLIGIIISVRVLLMSALIPIGGRIADRFNRQRLVIGGSLFFFLAIVLIPLASGFRDLFLLSALMACGGALSIPAASALTVDEGRKFGMGSMMAMLTVGMNIGMALGPVISGSIVDLTGINSAFYFGGAAVITGAGLFMWFTGKYAAGVTG